MELLGIMYHINNMHDLDVLNPVCVCLTTAIWESLPKLSMSLFLFCLFICFIYQCQSELYMSLLSRLSRAVNTTEPFSSSSTPNTPPLFVSGNLILVRFWTFLRNGLITALLNAKRERWRMVCNWIKTIAHHRTRQPHLRCRCFPPLVTANSLLKIGVVVF